MRRGAKRSQEEERGAEEKWRWGEEDRRRGGEKERRSGGEEEGFKVLTTSFG